VSRSVWGIDLGTTNSCIARATSTGVEVIPIDDAPTVPSVLAWNGEEFLVGRRAANQAVLSPDQAVRSIKRHMGDAEYRVRLGGAELDPIDVSARILGYLKMQAQARTGEMVEGVVITVPAWFTEPQRRATVAAGERAGLEVIRIINEPTAAALAYGQSGVDRPRPVEPGAGERWLVYDLGGGTFDVSILSVAGQYKEVLASCGNTYLGGDDFDHRIVLHWVDLIRHRHDVDVTGDRLAMARLRHLAETSKIRLSTEVQARAQTFLEVAGRTVELDELLTRAALGAMIDDYIDSTIAKAHQALEEAHTSIRELDRVLMVGGSTRIPRVQERVEAAFGIRPDAYIDADLSVALGAALQAALDRSLSAAQIVVDIAPHALGIAVLGAEDEAVLSRAVRPKLFIDGDDDGDGDPTDDGLHYPRTFAPVIRKNARLPAKFVEEFYTLQDGQDGVEVVVLQGESTNTRENLLVGAFRVTFDAKPAGSPIHVGFEYDRSGLVRVSVSGEDGTRIIKSHTLDLGRSAEANSDAQSLRSLTPRTDRSAALADDDDNTDELAQPSPQLSNFLIEQIERELARGAAPGHAEIQAALARYRALLADGLDAEIDEIEDQLYDWLDAARTATGPKHTEPSP
jgi:molecular chaperone DnaK